MKLTEKAKIYHSVWCCAHKRRYLYRQTKREDREYETILMCLTMKSAKWWEYDSEKKKHL